MKKLIAILLALSIVFTVPCMAFAAGESDVPVTEESDVPSTEEKPVYRLDTLRGIFVTLPLTFMLFPLMGTMTAMEIILYNTYEFSEFWEVYTEIIAYNAANVSLPEFCDYPFSEFMELVTNL